MLLISGRFGLVLVLFALFLWYGRPRFDALAGLPAEAFQLVTLLALYGLAAMAAAVVVRTLRFAHQFMTSDEEAS